MALIIWDDIKYGVGLNSIDEQHKKLVDLINKLHDGMLKGASKLILKEIIDEMIKYTKYHFGYEEENMKKFGFPDFDEHKKVHDAFTDKVITFQEKYLVGEILLSIEIINFLRDWLLTHIAGTDRKYIELFKRNGIV